MFVIKETQTQVCGTKVRIPKEYNLRKKDRKIYGVWIGDRILYLADEIGPLKAKAGKEGMIQEIRVDSESRIEVPSRYDKATVSVRGCISSIEVEIEK